MHSAIAMPQSLQPHIPCFAKFQATGEVCEDLRPSNIAANNNNKVPLTLKAANSLDYNLHRQL